MNTQPTQAPEVPPESTAELLRRALKAAAMGEDADI